MSVKITYGLYHYSYVANDAQMREEASGFIRLCKTCKPSYPCYIDMEDADGWKRRNGVSDAMNVETCYYTCQGWKKPAFMPVSMLTWTGLQTISIHPAWIALINGWHNGPV